jgi:hypothetical protein
MKPPNFSTAAFFRAIASESITVEMVDSLLYLGARGFRMETIEEIERETETPVDSWILTVGEGRLCFGGKAAWPGEMDLFLPEDRAADMLANRTLNVSISGNWVST